MLECGVIELNRATDSVINDTALKGLMGEEPAPCEHAHQLEQILDVVPEHMYILERDATLSFANRAVREYLGYMDDDSRTARLTKIIHPDDVDTLLQAYDEARKPGISVEAEARVRNKGGQYRRFLHQLVPLCDVQGHIVRWCGTLIDIEDQKQSLDRARNENLALREEIDTVSMFEEIVGISPALQAVLARVTKVAPTDSTVLITGETGTGKELIARAIHKHSQRSSKPFISVNCAAIPKDLIASELFGHEKGAFTGALQRRIGRFEQAEGGTIFLDEIGELPAETQVALLRVLQEREFDRVGGTHPIRANVRVIAATHRDLPAAIENGSFRSDLFYRINVFPVEVPSLRERSGDIPLLVKYFIDRYSSKAGKKMNRIRKGTLDRLKSYSWPGNIRELQNVIERSVILCDTDEFSVDESWLFELANCSRPLADKIDSQEKQLIEAALVRSSGRVSGPTGAATALGMPPSTLDSKIKALRIDKRQFQAGHA